MSKRKEIGYVSPEESRRRTAMAEEKVFHALESDSEITTYMMCQAGLDVSVARRVLADMHQRGLLNLRVEDSRDRRHFYSKAGPMIMRLPWTNSDNGAVLGCHRGER